MFPESQHGAALRPPARGLERQNRKRRPRLIHSLRARGSAGGGVESRGCGTRTTVDRSPDCGASPLPPPPARARHPGAASERRSERAQGTPELAPLRIRPCSRAKVGLQLFAPLPGGRPATSSWSILASLSPAPPVQPQPPARRRARQYEGAALMCGHRASEHGGVRQDGPL